MQLRQSSREKVSQLKQTILELQQSRQTCQNELNEKQQLLQLAQRSYFPVSVI